jgi:hypothetical protein
MSNKKILNATPVSIDGIEFHSQLEERLYKYLKKRGIDVQYEPQHIKIWDCDKLTVPYYDKRGGVFQRITTKPVCITYTPDFTFVYKGVCVFLEAKGFANDVFSYKAKLFREWLEKHSIQFAPAKYCYAVVYSIKNLETLLTDLDNGTETV